MTTWSDAALILLALLAAVQFLSIALAAWRCRARHEPLPYRPGSPAVSIVRPVCGIENYGEETLRSGFRLDYPDYELVFCVAKAGDPVIGLVERLIDENPDIPARILIGDDRISDNPKLNNCVKGWKAARHDWIVLADSNVLMPPDYIQLLQAAFVPGTGLVCSPPVGSRPTGFFAELECAFLNTYQARWQYAADTLGFGFAQGKTMFWRRDVLDNAGGIEALASEIAEDAASTKIVRAAGLRVRLVDGPFAQPLGLRSLADVWNRQVRWARLRRATFKLYFIPEILTGVVPPTLAAVIAAPAVDAPALPFILALWALWYGSEYGLALTAGWRPSVQALSAWVLRDFMLPAVWVEAWRGDGFVWRGHQMSVAESRPSA